LTTPSHNDNQPKAHAANFAGGHETSTNLRDDTVSAKPASLDVLPEDLSDNERLQANEALGFLTQVRAAVRESGSIPKTIGRYSILRSLGRGGFAEVFLAKDEELDRRVALKVPLFNTSVNDPIRQRFEREARLAASLGHPQIVPVYEYGELGPVQFIAFAWCDGPTLSDWMNNHGSVEFETAAQVVLHLAEAVQHAHQRGVVHRDLKPANILVDATATSDDAPVWEKTRITDFGLARNFDEHDKTLTQDGQIVGTPAYMAPEQADGKFEAGPPADVWALGMILFEMLTKQLPFRRSEMLATARAICDEPAPRVRSLRPKTPAGLDAIVDLCLRKDPSNRYESAHELAQDLRRWLNNEPVKARPLSRLSKFAMWSRRNPVVAALIGLTIASLSIGLGVALWQRDIAIRNLEEANAQTIRADGNLETAQTLIEEIVALEQKLSSQSQFAKERTSLIKRAADLQVKLNRDEEQTPEIRFNTAKTLAKLSPLLLRLGERKASFDNTQVVLDLLKNLDKEHPLDATRNQIYRMRFKQRMSMGSVLVVSAPNRALELFDANEADVPPPDFNEFEDATLRAENLRARSMVFHAKQDRKSASEALHRAVACFDGISPKNPAQELPFHYVQCNLYATLGMLAAEVNNMHDAEKYFTKANDNLLPLKASFSERADVKNTIGLISMQRGGIFENKKDIDSAIEQYQICRNTYLALYTENSDVGNYGNFYVLASVALCRCHFANESPDLGNQVAAETFKTAEAFSDKIKNSQSFKDNINFIKRSVQNAAKAKSD
jgi:hypothetical protein